MYWIILPPFVYCGLFIPMCHTIKNYANVTRCLLRFQIMHNFLLATFSFAMTFLSVYYLSLRTFSVHGWVCESPESAPMYEYAWLFSKIYEWLDTMYLILNDKKVSSLHRNHHASTTSLVALHYMNRKTRTSIVDVPILLNSIAHVFMYLYYMNSTFFSKIKKIITRIQIIQHFSVLLLICYSIYQKNVYECDINIFTNIVSFLVYLMYFVQFYLFYYSTYSRKKNTLSHDKQTNGELLKQS